MTAWVWIHYSMPYHSEVPLTSPKYGHDIMTQSAVRRHILGYVHSLKYCALFYLVMVCLL